MTEKPDQRPFWRRHASTLRFIVALAIGFCSAFVFPLHLHPVMRSVAAWDVGAVTLLVAGWFGILRASPEVTRRRAAADDLGRSTVGILAVVSSLVSLLASIEVLRRVQALPEDRTWLGLTIVLGANVLSWLVTHTAFSLRYAHLYYDDECEGTGMAFPGDERPAEIDFAYFAFTVGMCFQVSDVVVTSSRIRRTVLVHAILSFVYNTTIVALALNIVSQFLS